MMRKFLLLTVAVLAVVGAPAAEAATRHVTIVRSGFLPTSITVTVGDTVTWTNNDSVGHDVTADSFSSGEPGGMAPGDTFEHTFEEAGSFDYVCTVHPGMEGTVTVE